MKNRLAIFCLVLYLCFGFAGCTDISADNSSVGRKDEIIVLPDEPAHYHPIQKSTTGTDGSQKDAKATTRMN